MARQGKIFIVLFSLIPVVAAADYTVKCQGTNSVTDAPVYGDCANGEFKGTDSITGNEVQGDCEVGGGFEAYDSVTDEYVAGDCDGIKEDEGGDEGDGEGEPDLRD